MEREQLKLLQNIETEVDDEQDMELIKNMLSTQ